MSLGAIFSFGDILQLNTWLILKVQLVDVHKEHVASGPKCMSRWHFLESVFRNGTNSSNSASEIDLPSSACYDATDKASLVASFMYGGVCMFFTQYVNAHTCSHTCMCVWPHYDILCNKVSFRILSGSNTSLGIHFSFGEGYDTPISPPHSVLKHLTANSMDGHYKYSKTLSNVC